MIVKDLIQFLEDFDTDMEVCIRSTCGLLDYVTSISKRPCHKLTNNKDVVLLEGKISADYFTKKEE